MEDAFDPALAGVGVALQSSGAAQREDGLEDGNNENDASAGLNNEEDTSMEESFKLNPGNPGLAAGNAASGSRMPPRSTSMQASTSSNGKQGQSKPHVLQVGSLSDIDSYQADTIAFPGRLFVGTCLRDACTRDRRDASPE